MDTYRCNLAENTRLLYPLCLPCLCRALGSKIPSALGRRDFLAAVQIVGEDNVSAVTKE